MMTIKSRLELRLIYVYDMEPDVAVRLSPAGEAAKQAESLSADEAAQEDLQA